MSDLDKVINITNKEASSLWEKIFGKRIVVNYETPKEIAVFRLKILTRFITHLIYFSIYTTLATFGYIAISQQADNTIAEHALKINNYVFLGVGHTTFGVVQWFIGWFTKNKVNKKFTIQNKFTPKKSIIGIVFMVISLLPPIIYIIGYFFIWLHFKKKNNIAPI